MNYKLIVKTKMLKTSALTLSFIAVSILISSCGGDRRPKAGVFLDSAVQGLRYATETQQGLTDEEGTFFYRIGEEVTFSIGSLVIATVRGDDVVTPMSLFDTADTADRRAVNVARLMLTLDENFDADGESTRGADDGILLLGSYQNYSGETSLDFDQPTSAFLSDTRFAALIRDILGDEKDYAGLLNSSDITAHLSATIEELSANTAPVISGITNNMTVNSGASVGLSASATDDGTIETAKWTQTSGSPDVAAGVTNDSQSVEESITVIMPTVDSTQVFNFTFTATDDDGISRSVVVEITVEP